MRTLDELQREVDSTEPDLTREEVQVLIDAARMLRHFIDNGVPEVPPYDDLNAAISLLNKLHA